MNVQQGMKQKGKENESTNVDWNSSETRDNVWGTLVRSLAGKMGKIRLKQPKSININPRNMRNSKTPALLTGYFKNMLESQS